jgi:hypothetical protein
VLLVEIGMRILDFNVAPKLEYDASLATLSSTQKLLVCMEIKQTMVSHFSSSVTPKPTKYLKFSRA